MTRRFKFSVSLFLTVAVFAMSFYSYLSGAQAAGATMYISPGKGTYTVGSSFSVSVFANSGGTAINAFEASMSFSKDLLQVTAIDKSSFVSMFAVEPTFSNTSGSVGFSAGVIKGYTGSAGKIITIRFKTKKAGSAKVSFNSGLLLTADGQGTNIYAGGAGGTFTIEDAKVVEPPKVVPPTQTKPVEALPITPNNAFASTAPVEVKNTILPPAPEVSSPTHTNVDTWYSKADAKFEWKSLSSVIGASVLMTDATSSEPASRTDGAIQSKEYPKVVNGVHYFHVKLQNKDGWGKTSHRKFMVDTELPTTPILSIENGGDATNPTPALKISAIDKVSGISKFKLNLNATNIELPSKDYVLEPYRFDRLLPGPYSVSVMAVDYAGNTSTSSLNFMVDPLRPPTITSIPKEIIQGTDMTVRGTSFYPQATIQLFFSKNNGEAKRYDTKTDDKGDWNLEYNDNGPIQQGGYQVWAKVVDSRGAESVDSNKNFLNVIKPDIVAAYGIFIILGLIFIIILLCIYIYHLKQKHREEQEAIDEEAKEAQRRISEVFAALHEEVDELMPLADKRPGLSEAERRVKEKLKEALNISEEFLAKEVEDIEKEIESNLGGKKK